MKSYKLTPVCGVLLLTVACGACGNMINKLKARDQLNKGVTAFRNAQFDAAVEHFQQAVTEDPQLINAWLYLAMSFYQQYAPSGDSAENIKMGKQAIQAFEDVLKMDSRNTTALTSIAQIYYYMKDFDKAKEFQRRRLEADPSNPEPYYWIGVINWAISYPRRMTLRKDLKLAAPKDPARPDLLPPLPEKARTELADKNGGLVDEGIKALQKYLEAKPNDSDGMAYLSLLDREKADLEAGKDASQEDLKDADTWMQKAMDARRQAAGRPATPPA